MKHPIVRCLALPVGLLLTHCTSESGAHGRLDTRLSAVHLDGASGLKVRAGAAAGDALESLKYQITSIMICESLEVEGSGFRNPNGCLSLYEHADDRFRYDVDGDWTPLAEQARATDDGFIDLLDEDSRAQLASSTALRQKDARSYHYGIINWSLPIKLKASVAMNGGGYLYTHDGETRVESVGVDGFRHYYTAPATPLDQGPAEESVVLLPNGGNWFKFQSPFVIRPEDISSEQAFVLDLVFNPDGIVKGFNVSSALGSISQRDGAGAQINDITVPMLDLAPVPHRADEQVMRESYRGTVALDGDTFDIRIELYYVEGAADETVYGVDAKSLVNADTRAVPPELTKISFLERANDGSLTLAAHKGTPVISGLVRQQDVGSATRVTLACGQHRDGAGAEGGAAIVVERCPAANLDVELVLTSRTPVQGGVSAGVGSGEAEDAGVVDADAEP